MDIEQLNIEKQFLFYLSKAGIVPEKMHPIQLQETKRAFFAGVSQVLHLMNTHVSQMDEQNAIAAINYMEQQAAIYWAKELKPDPNEKTLLVPKEAKIITLNQDAKTE